MSHQSSKGERDDTVTIDGFSSSSSEKTVAINTDQKYPARRGDYIKSLCLKK